MAEPTTPPSGPVTDPLSNRHRGRATAADIESLCKALDQKHPLERKLRFLLDCRGYLKVQGLAGAFVEFGCFNGQTVVAAHHVLGSCAITEFVGLDTFAGEPAPEALDEPHTAFHAAGAFHADFADTRDFVTAAIGARARLIRGDFRRPEALEELEASGPIAIAMVDCNYPSSTVAALEAIMNRCVAGACLYLDDFLTLLSDDDSSIDLQVAALASSAGRRAIPLGFYPPFGRSYVVRKSLPREAPARSLLG
jgi:hypothetical protein